MKETVMLTLLNHRNCHLQIKLLRNYFQPSNKYWHTIQYPEVSPLNDTVKHHHQKYRDQAKTNSERRTSDNHYPVVNGRNRVLIKRGTKNNKFQSIYSNGIYTVTKITGTMVTVKSDL